MRTRAGAGKVRRSVSAGEASNLMRCPGCGKLGHCKWRLKPCTETLQEPFRSRNVGGGANRSDRA